MTERTKDQYIEALRQEVSTMQEGLTDLAELIIKQQEYLTQIRRVLCSIKTASDGQAELERLKEELEYEILRWRPSIGTNPLSRTIAEAELAALKAALERLPESFAEEVQP